MPETEEYRDEQLEESGDDREDSALTEAPEDAGQGEDENLEGMSAQDALDRLGFKSLDAAEKSKLHAAQKISEQGEIIARLSERLEAIEYAQASQRQGNRPDSGIDSDDWGGLGMDDDGDMWGMDRKKLDSYIDKKVNEKVGQGLGTALVRSAFADIMENDPDWTPQTAQLMSQEWQRSQHLIGHPRYASTPDRLVRELWKRAKTQREQIARQQGDASAEQLIRALETHGYDISSLKKEETSTAASPPPGTRAVPKGKVKVAMEKQAKAIKDGDPRALLDAMFESIDAHGGLKDALVERG